MSNSIIQTLGYITINGQKFRLSNYFQNISFNLGTTGKHVSTMQPDGSSNTILTSKQPTITFSYPLVTKELYIALFDTLYSSLDPTIILQTFVIGDKSPAGPSFAFTGCKASSYAVGGQTDNEMVESYTVIAENYSTQNL